MSPLMQFFVEGAAHGDERQRRETERQERRRAKSARLLHRRPLLRLPHRRVPTNDGGISLGQAVIANAMMIAQGI